LERRTGDDTRPEVGVAVGGKYLLFVGCEPIVDGDDHLGELRRHLDILYAAKSGTSLKVWNL
jgi:hypothetical protein